MLIAIFFFQLLVYNILKIGPIDAIKLPLSSMVLCMCMQILERSGGQKKVYAYFLDASYSIK